MSTSLLAMAPFVLLAIVSSLCFVGCVLNTTGEGVGNPPAPAPVFKYSDNTVLADSDRLLAYWRLNEAAGPVAVNAAKPGTADGKYVSQMFAADSNFNSAEAPGTLLFGLAGLLSGDLQAPFTAGSSREPAISVNGGFVSVDWDPLIAPAESDGFTLEAWVDAGWGEKDVGFDRGLLGTVESTGGFRGFGIMARKNEPETAENWNAFVGNGTNATFVAGGEATPGTTYHLVATYAPGVAGAQGKLTLWVNGSETSTPATYVPATGVGAPDAPSRFIIGCGGSHLPVLKIPYVGRIQCVALYRGAFTSGDVQKHLTDGNAS